MSCFRVTPDAEKLRAGERRGKMIRCSTCLSSGPVQGRSSCSSCNWRSTRQLLASVPEAGSREAAWQVFFEGLRDPGDRLGRIRLFAMILGEDPADTEARAIASLASGDAAGYDAELLRLAKKLLARIHEF